LQIGLEPSEILF